MYRWIAVLAVFMLSPLVGAEEFTPKQQKQLNKTTQKILSALEGKNYPAFERLRP